MKILVVDDEQSFGALLGHTLKRLGHKPVLAMDPRDALGMLTPDIDAVITDIDMPAMTGVELAHAIRARDRDMPVAFCTGSDPASEAIQEAHALGRVLPKVWTIADVKSVVEDLRRSRAGTPGARPAPGRSPASAATDAAVAEALDEDTMRTGRMHHVRVSRTPSPPGVAAVRTRPLTRRIKISLRRWAQVTQLCDNAKAGPVYFTVRGSGDLQRGAALLVALVLPDEITVAVAAEVHTLRPASAENEREIVVELTGLNAELSARLRSLAAPAAHANPVTSYLHVAPRVAALAPTPRNDELPQSRLARGSQRKMSVSEIIRNNNELRHQIEGLAQRMRPRRDPDDAD
jgi:CheY-like chemotaxis protein